MSTTWYESKNFMRLFKDRHKRTGPDERCRALPVNKPYRWLNQFQGRLTVKKKRKLLPGLVPASPHSFTLPWKTPYPSAGMLTGFPFAMLPKNREIRQSYLVA